MPDDCAVKRVVIEVTGHEHPIVGIICAEHEPALRFVGWIGLLAALEEALDPPDQRRETRSADGTGA